MQLRTTGLAVTALCFLFALSSLAPACHAAQEKVQILATTFPVYQITRNITAGNDAVEVDLLIPAQLGCPHDYVLVPQDMQKLAKSAILVINGLGLEEFTGAPVKKANPVIKIIDSSSGIDQLLKYTKDEQNEQSRADHDDEHNGETNPHLFASPRMAALLAKNIALSLTKFDPSGARIYAANATAYIARLDRLADELEDFGKRLSNNRIITQHGVFDYLARDMGLDVVAVVQAHAGQEPAASEMLAIIEKAKREKAGAIFTEPQYPEAVGKTIAKEAGIATATLDPAATGAEDAPLDYYETVMRNNMTTLEKTLGAH